VRFQRYSAIAGIRLHREEIQIGREIALARLTGARVHIARHFYKQGVELVKRAKEAELNVTAEVTPHI